MIFTEIAMESVRCFKKQYRLTPKQGYNLFYGSNESGKSTVQDCILILLDPLRQVSEKEAFQSWGPPGNSRIGLVMAEGNQMFRVTRDFVNGQVTLSQANPQTNKYDVIAQDHAQVDSILRDKLGIPTVDMYRKLFVFDKADMPSGRPKVIVQKVAAPAAQAPAQGAGYGNQVPGMPGEMPPGPGMPPPQAPVGYGMNPEQIKQQIETFKQQIESASKIQDVQYEIDELESKLFDMENKTREITTQEKKIDELRASLSSLQSLNDLPPDIIKRIEFFEDVEKEHKRKVYQVEEQLNRNKAALSTLTNREDFFKEKFFMGGIGGIVGGIILKIMLDKEILPDISLLKLFPPLLIIAGLGLIFWVLWNEFSSRIKEGEVGKEVDKIEEEKNDELKKFEVEGSVVHRLMDEAGVETSKELNKKLKEFLRRTELLDDLDEKVKKTKIEVKYDQLEKDRDETKNKIDELNKELQTSGGREFSQDPADLQRQVDALQYVLDNPDAAPPAAGPPPGVPGYGADAPGTGMPPPPPMGNPMQPAQPIPPPMPGQYDGGGLGGGGGEDYLGGGGDDYLAGGFDQEASGPGYDSNPDPDSTFVSTGAGETGAGPGPGPAGPSGGGIETMVDDLWAAAEQFSGMNRSILVPQLTERFNIYLQAFTGKKYNEGDLSSEKNISLRNVLGSYTDLQSLSPSTQDAAWLALKVSIIEQMYQKKKLPVLLDDPLRNLDDTRLAMVSKALKRIGSACQVILLSTQRAHSKIADHTVNIVAPE